MPPPRETKEQKERREAQERLEKQRRLQEEEKRRLREQQRRLEEEREKRAELARERELLEEQRRATEGRAGLEQRREIKKGIPLEQMPAIAGADEKPKPKRLRKLIGCVALSLFGFLTAFVVGAAIIDYNKSKGNYERTEWDGQRVINEYLGRAPPPSALEKAVTGAFGPIKNLFSSIAKSYTKQKTAYRPVERAREEYRSSRHTENAEERSRLKTDIAPAIDRQTEYQQERDEEDKKNKLVEIRDAAWSAVNKAEELKEGYYAVSLSSADRYLQEGRKSLERAMEEIHDGQGEEENERYLASERYYENALKYAESAQESFRKMEEANKEYDELKADVQFEYGNLENYLDYLSSQSCSIPSQRAEERYGEMLRRVKEDYEDFQHEVNNINSGASVSELESLKERIKKTHSVLTEAGKLCFWVE
ncbi:hypothetical protein HZB88_02560 [archaeon]|nr:hypothetical protein [archaeon]